MEEKIVKKTLDKGLTEMTEFEKLKMALDYAGYNTLIKPIDQENMVEQCFVALNRDQKNLEEPLVVQLIFTTDQFKEPELENEEDSHILQFFINLPVNLKKERYWEMFRLLSIFSGLLPVGGFHLNDADGIYFRYCLVTEEREINAGVLVEILGMISFFVNKLFKGIKDFGEGPETIEQVIGAAEKALNDSAVK
jgi:hypothetical protein